MLSTVWGVVRDGKIELLEPVEISEGTKVLVTLPPSDDTDFWLQVSQTALDAVWNNPEDDVYGQLLTTDEQGIENSLRGWLGL